MIFFRVSFGKIWENILQLQSLMADYRTSHVMVSHGIVVRGGEGGLCARKGKADIPDRLIVLSSACSLRSFPCGE